MSLSLPQSPTVTTVVNGIVQTDLIVKSALAAGFRDLRNNPILLDYCFASLLHDPTTKEDLRIGQIEAAKAWFLEKEIPILFYPRLDQMQFPCLTVAQQDSNEGPNNLGDMHQIVSEPGYSPVDITVGPFSPKAYDVTTGIMTLPDQLVPFYATEAMVVVDNAGKVFSMVGRGSGSTLVLAPNTVGKFNRITIKSASANATTKLESTYFNEIFSIGCHTQGESVYAIYLSSIVLFALLRYRQSFLEEREFERTTLKLGPVIPLGDAVNGKENVFSRYIQLSGYVQHGWPKETFPNILSVATRTNVVNANLTPAPLNATRQLWYGVNDPA